MLVVLFVCLSFFYFITMFGGFVVFVGLCVFWVCLFVCFWVEFGLCFVLIVVLLFEFGFLYFDLILGLFNWVWGLFGTGCVLYWCVVFLYGILIVCCYCKWV